MGDPRPPDALERLQRRFGDSIATEFEFLEDDTVWRPRVEHYAEDVLREMTPRGDLSGPERLATYNQQYWFRLFTVMQKEYPLLRHLLGVSHFNRMVSAYLTRYPSRSPSLRYLSARLRDFLAEDHEWNRPVLRECAELEFRFIETFDAAQLPPLDPDRLEPEEAAELIERPLRFQPHWFLFEEHWNLVELRRRVRGDDDDEIEVEPVARHALWAGFRGATGITTRQLGVHQFRLLERLHGGAPLGTACDDLAAGLEGDDLRFVEENVQGWFARWVAEGWFVTPGA